MLLKFALKRVPIIRSAADIMPAMAYRTLDFAIYDLSQHGLVFEIAYFAAPIAKIT
jgi:hypothetical protein